MGKEAVFVEMAQGLKLKPKAPERGKLQDNEPLYPLLRNHRVSMEIQNYLTSVIPNPHNTRPLECEK